MSLLEVRDVRVRFGGNVALDGVNLTVEAGLVTGLIGPNGAGKTTLFNAITGLNPPDRGVVMLDGNDITSLKPHQRARRGLARTFQKLELFRLLSVRENVALAATMRKRHSDWDGDIESAAEDAVTRVGLLDMIDERVDALPTGQARLVEIARALATGPRILLLDEPASGQDENETAALSELLTSLASDDGIGVLIVEHDMELVMSVCERIHVLDVGYIIASGTPEQIRSDPRVLEAYLGSEPA